MMPDNHPQTMIYALDFDGVICDSAVELAMSGWQVARLIWPDMPEACDDAIISAYREVRPIIETGYETIPIMRLLHQGVGADEIMADYHALLFATIESANSDVPTLKRLFGAYRDQWIANDEIGWLNYNPLFPSIAEKLKTLEGRIWTIITTKQERFAHKVLQANGITLPAERLFGLDRQMTKQEVLEALQERHNLPITFVEDRMPTLSGILKNKRLSSIHLQLADWGYNTKTERETAREKGIELVSIERFLGSCSGR
ncbi:MAG: HAD family hydrolase [Thiotrichales bacterium]